MTVGLLLDDWFAEGGDELGKPIEVVEEETDRHLGTWNEQGRALCSAFLDTASRLARS